MVVNGIETSTIEVSAPQVTFISDSRKILAVVTNARFGNGPRAFYNRAVMLKYLVKNRSILRPLLDAPKGSALDQMLASNPALYEIGKAPYIHADWSSEERLCRFAAHINALEHSRLLGFAPDLSIEVFPFTEIAPNLSLVIDKAAWFQREGTLVMNLFENSVRLFSLAFSFETTPTGSIALIGGLQGRNLPGIMDTYRVLTKELHGTRPRDLLIETFRMFCRFHAIKEIWAVTDACRHHRSLYFGKDTQRALPLDYDEAWRDRGALKVVDGFAILSVEREDRDETEIPARKRSLYRKRYALLDDIEQSFADQWTRAVPFKRQEAD